MLKHSYGTPILTSSHLESIQQNGYQVARILAEHKTLYEIATETSILIATLAGSMRYTAKDSLQWPIVGDWVLFDEATQGQAIIHKVLPRQRALRRRAASSESIGQWVGSHLDYALVVQSLNRDFNRSRLERYLALCFEADIQPILLLTMTDLHKPDQIQQYVDEVHSSHPNLPVLPISNTLKTGLENLEPYLIPQTTYCLLGSSGAGKSSLLNNLMGQVSMRTGNLSESTSKGRHTTSHRQLFLLSNGSILMDNPGMREVGLEQVDHGIANTFSMILELTHKCRFRDCSHRHEKGCAVLDALKNGLLEDTSYKNFIKLKLESEHYETMAHERRQRDRSFGKMLKNYHKQKDRS